jgi:glycogen debranching enzyme
VERSAVRLYPHKPGLVLILLVLLFALLYSPLAQAQLPFDTDSVAPERFIAAHGRKAVVMGYAASGLELWAYPLQLISGYELGFRSAGETTEIKGSALLRRITYEPEAVIRTYVGPDFIVSEKLFVPLNEQAIFLTYTVECRHTIDVVIHFTPVLDLMWPASMGGQYTRWDPTASAYVLGEETHKYHAWIGSSAVVSHDQVVNSAQPGTLGKQLAFAVRAGGEAGQSATVVVARSNDGSSPAPRMRDLVNAETKFETEARDHYEQLLANTVRIETPDHSINQQLAWAQIALDQAWVCNDVLGCGRVAGYGPSRNGRRPQYDWFFAGDGLITIDALVNSGAYDRAKQALAFIAKYQDARTGMIWHEISQSADPADWATKYPYMFVHVDITFHYLITMAHYVSASGDTQFAQQNWSGLEAAYRYCESLLNADDGLPRIPSSKEGGNEQDRMTDDVGLATSWMEASEAFARMATWTGHAPLAEQAQGQSERARASIAHRYWDDQHNSWIDGYDASGHTVTRRSDDAVNLVGILDQGRSNLILNQLASADFETDWGTRGVAASSRRFDPDSYASGSVSPLGTAAVASAFWSEHRPDTALPIWSALVPWGTLDSMGHLHELLTGDFYHQQAESVPEQTWSSAVFLTAAVRGLVGLTREAQTNRLEFSPHLPSSWNRMSISNIRGSDGHVAMTLTRVPEGLELQTENSGAPVDLLFSPEIPLGTHLRGAELDGKRVEVRSEAHEQDMHATLTFKLPKGKSRCLIRYEGGVLLSVDRPAPLVGEASKDLRLISVVRKGASLVLEVEASADAPHSIIELRTSEKPLQVRGAKLMPVSPSLYDLTVDPVSIEGRQAASGAYHRFEIVVDLADQPAAHDSLRQ